MSDETPGTTVAVPVDGSGRRSMSHAEATRPAVEIVRTLCRIVGFKAPVEPLARLLAAEEKYTRANAELAKLNMAAVEGEIEAAAQRARSFIAGEGPDPGEFPGLVALQEKARLKRDAYVRLTFEITEQGRQAAVPIVDALPGAVKAHIEKIREDERERWAEYGVKEAGGGLAAQLEAAVARVQKMVSREKGTVAFTPPKKLVRWLFEDGGAR